MQKQERKLTGSTVWRGLLTDIYCNRVRLYLFINFEQRLNAYPGKQIIMGILIEQTENELRAEIDFWTNFVSSWCENRDEPVHPRAFEALDHAQSRLEYLLTDKNREAENRGYLPVLH